MPVYDLWCKNCGYEEKDVFLKMDESNGDCPMCSYPLDRAVDRLNFKLKYNPKTDMVDWDGNRTRRYDAWKNLPKEKRKDMWLPDE